ncbi:hypothetical protein NBRC3299_1015 [Acetobacter pasteurianus NBRC 3299]|uniref:Uncharacterized protein n=1 Tax=Acetobacter ascendens TaxID=481146 RepID=A0A1Y0V2X7_9PROT|nr:hypothetical protein S101447_00161 [Acetobacter ascendens]GCD74723.1 hypothetical protein NBRC3299_1015 [Acetobacter pasteurianus NBRC 3299]
MKQELEQQVFFHLPPDRAQVCDAPARYVCAYVIRAIGFLKKQPETEG